MRIVTLCLSLSVLVACIPDFGSDNTTVVGTDKAGVEAMRNVVLTTFEDAGFAMHWNTVPVLPMMASIEVTNWPNTGPWGVVLSYGVWVPLGQHADLGLRIGYQGRTSDLGSLGYGGALSWSF